MEILKNAKIIRLRSHHEKYLAADDDKETVGQERYGSTRRAKWEVEEHGNSNEALVRLKSCYGLYLTASNTPFLLGASGHKVLQTKPERLDSSVQWELIKEGGQFKLKTRYGNFLRANGGLPPWRNSVTHHIPHRSSTQDWLLWDIDILEFKINPNYQHQFERPSVSRSSSLSEASSSSGPILFKQKSSGSLPNSPPRSNGRVIQYYVATNTHPTSSDEENQNDISLFEFKGSSVDELKHGLEEETGLKDIVVCTRSQLDGKLYPLRLHLPPNNVAMTVVVVPSHLHIG